MHRSRMNETEAFLPLFLFVLLLPLFPFSFSPFLIFLFFLPSLLSFSLAVTNRIITKVLIKRMKRGWGGGRGRRDVTIDP